MNPAEAARPPHFGRATIIDGLRSLELYPAQGAAAAVYREPIAIRLLYQDSVSGEEHYLVRYPAGLSAHLHRHTAAHTIVVLEGRLKANDQTVGPAAYAHFPPREPMRHEAADGMPCLFVILFHGPFDVEVLAD